MKQFFNIDPWKIIQDEYTSEINRIAESVFSIGNGKMGQRANFEEEYSGDKLQGNYIAGVYYTDKTRVGWWKNGYPKYFAKVLNAVNWIGLKVNIDDEILDLNQCKVHSFERVLDMQNGMLQRKFIAETPKGKQVEVEAERFYSMHQDQLGIMRYKIKALNFAGTITIQSYLDFDIRNEDANYDEMFWNKMTQGIDDEIGFVAAKTKKTEFLVETAMKNKAFVNGQLKTSAFGFHQEELQVSHHFQTLLEQGDSCEIQKFTTTVSSFYQATEDIHNHSIEGVNEAFNKGYDILKQAHCKVWEEKWANHDIKIEGDAASQQAMRFNIFQLNQTYTGKDERLNIGPKGFTGEKYGGSTYWDTEAYCLPFYQSTADQTISLNLLMYRYNHLEKAIENASKLGFDGGAALYPMVTMNGEECHNEWEITFEEIHRNGAIAYAIFDYTRYFNDSTYLKKYGIEVLIAISRFWAQRFNFSAKKQQYVMLGVTGPNEFENNVNNNWYTNYIAKWCLEYTFECLEDFRRNTPGRYKTLINKLQVDTNEVALWKDIIKNVYLPYDKKRKIYLQQDGFLDKEIIPVKQIPKDQLPIVHHWSWDRILRSCYIKQADVLQGMYFFEDHFTKEDLERHFDYYEPLTVHESSLSPCVHSILAAKLNRPDKAYEMFLRTARLDLDNMNDDTKDGCHITSMAGTWLSFVKGIGGMSIKNGKLNLQPILPKEWKEYSYSLLFRGSKLLIKVKNDQLEILKTGIEEPLKIIVNNKKTLLKNDTINIIKLI
jgi:maltose phosphorylase